MSLALRYARAAFVHDSRLSFNSFHGSVRFCSSSSSCSSNSPEQKPEKPQPQSKLKQSRDAMRDNVKGYVFTRFIDIVKNYDKVLEKNFPTAAKVYRVFFDGVKFFYADMKRYLKISRIVKTSPNGFKALNRKELELYMQMPRDMIKVAPALVMTSLPMVGYALFPLVYMYPRTFLTAHFWTLQQKAEFQTLKLQERLSYNRPVFRCLQAKLKSVEDHKSHFDLKYILGLIGSGFHPTIEALLIVKDIFATPPYSLEALSAKHIKHLIQLHGLPGGLFKRVRLAEHAYLVHNMDLAIRREGDVHNMQPEALKYACYLRGLNPSNLSNEEMIEWLRRWIAVSTSIEEDHISMFLHLPLFLAYNYPNNWQLVYGSSSSSKSNNNGQTVSKALPIATPTEKQMQIEDELNDRRKNKPPEFADLETRNKTSIPASEQKPIGVKQQQQQ